jgi:hypothetical protein
MGGDSPWNNGRVYGGHTRHGKVLPAPRPLRVRSDLHGPALLWPGDGVQRILDQARVGSRVVGHVGTLETLN